MGTIPVYGLRCKTNGGWRPDHGTIGKLIKEKQHTKH